MVRKLVRSASLASIVLSLSVATVHAAQGEARLVDRKAGRPMVLAFDVAPGYLQHVLLPAAEGDAQDTSVFAITLSAPDDLQPGPGQWLPTAFVCLRPADLKSKASHCANVTLDSVTTAHGVARAMSATGETLIERTTARQFYATSPIEVRVVRTGRHVTTTIDGETIDESEVPFAPAFWMIGASTGVARIEAVETPEETLAADRWPVTLQAAVDDALAQLDEADRSALRETPKADLVRFLPGWGVSLRDRQGLARGNGALRIAACGPDCDATEAVAKIMEGVWAALQTGETR